MTRTELTDLEAIIKSNLPDDVKKQLIESYAIPIIIDQDYKIIMSSHRPVRLFEGLGYDNYGKVYIFNPVKFADDLKDKDDPELEQEVLKEAYNSRDFPIIERIILETREYLNKVEVFE